MTEGKVSHIVKEKGFGFICIDGMEKDLFFHTKDFSGDFLALQAGDKVTVESVKDGPKGPSAKGVKLK